MSSVLTVSMENRMVTGTISRLMFLISLCLTLMAMNEPEMDWAKTRTSGGI